MIRKMTILATLIALFGMGSAPAAAQNTIPGSILYKLAPESTYQHGCFEPCMCPLMEQADLAGTFELRPTGSDGLFDHYDVTNVRWTATTGSGFNVTVTGAGTYRIGGEFARRHQLSLDLAVEGQPVEHFDSGLVVGGSEFPAIVTTISMHGVFCLDTVMEVFAKPVPILDVQDGALSWDAVPLAAGYDLVRGNLTALRATGGNLTIATEECLAHGFAGTTLPFAAAPSPGAGFWFVLRYSRPDQVDASYDSGFASQIRSRDPGINAAAAACP